MSRAGDDDASRAVDAWVPGLGGTTPPVLASLRAPKVERVSLVRDPAFENDRAQEVVSAPDGSVLALAGQTLVAVDSKTEVVNWRQERVAALLHCGDDTLILTRERSGFLRRAGGVELVAGAGLIGQGVVDSAVLWGDRMVVRSFVSPGELLQAFDIGDAFGRLLWQQEVRDVVQSVAGNVALIVRDVDSEARDLESGRALWDRTAAENGELPYVWWDHDRAGVLFHTWLERGARTTSIDPRTGLEHWSVAHERTVGSVALTPSLFVAEREEQHLEAYARDDGRLVWSSALPPSDSVVAYATGGDALYVASTVGQALRLLVLDLESGAVRTTVAPRLPAEGTVCAVWVREMTVEVLLANRRDQVAIVRFAD
jgi:hypothetical protein